MPIHLEYVSKRFPEMRMQILELTLINLDFQEACKDYEYVCADLSRLEIEDQAESSTASELHRLREELEVEILDTLKANVRKFQKPLIGEENDAKKK